VIARKANNTIEKVRQLQRKLYRAAKANKNRKFHALYDKTYRMDVLKESWKRVKTNGGAGGIDHVTISDVEAYGIDKFLNELQAELKEGKYRPCPVRRSYIPKKNGEKRPLGIPVIKDRVVQMAVKIVIEPVFEADFKESSYGFRPKRSAHQALEVIRLGIYKQKVVIDADIKSYFDNISHEKLMKLVCSRIMDKRIIKLIWKWLKAGVMEEGKYKESEKGAPQGGVISPLLSNIYLDYMDYKWDKHYKDTGTLVRYADDFVILCKTENEATRALQIVESIMNRLELKLHPDKTRIVNLWDDKAGFDFLGYHHRRDYVQKINGQKRVEVKQIPSRKAMENMRQNIRETFNGRSRVWMSMEQMIEALNPKITGMRNYYGRTYAARRHLAKIDNYIMIQFTLWYNRKKQRRKKYGGMKKVWSMVYKYGLKKVSA
jgi:RNA-directed DNA polymerase